MNFDKLLLYKILSTTKRSKATLRKGFTFFKNGTSKKVFKQFVINNCVIDRKYLITKATTDRLNNIPISEIHPRDFKFLNKKEGQVGFVCFYDNIHFIYAILKNEIIILSANGNINNLLSGSPAVCTNGELYINVLSDSYRYHVNNPLHLLNCDETESKRIVESMELDEVKVLKEMIKENKNSLEGKRTFKELTGPITERYIDYYDKQQNRLETALKAFIFIHMAKVTDKTFVCDDSGISIRDKLKKKKTTNTDIIRIDSKWDSNIKVINPFGVSGHFRRQPYGTGRNMTKTIYIDAFMKTGYTAKARIYQD